MIRFLITADLHYGIKEEVNIGIKNALKKWKQYSPIDVFIIAGDVAENITLRARQYGRNHIEIINLIKNTFNCPVVFCSGNHDLWTQSKNINSWQIYRELLPKIAEKTHSIYLDESSFYINNTAIVGTYGHYDYSLAEENISIDGKKLCEEDFKRKLFIIKSKHRMLLWNDKIYLRFKEDDKRVCSSILKGFEARLKHAIEKRDRIIVISHTIPRKEMNAHRFKKNPETKFFSAFSGTKKLSEIVEKYNKNHKIILFVSGHTHLPVEYTIINEIAYVNIGGDYGDPKAFIFEVS